ncbi:MAG: sensor histidine kinase [Synergistaceae bacterium]|nr:sensor histidine kinase [Synergistaceae bacterium]
MKTLARLYVENFTENLASHLDSMENSPVYTDIFFESAFGGNSEIGHYMLFRRLPAFFAVMNSDGVPIYCSERLRDIVEKVSPPLPIGMAREIYSPSGEQFTIAVLPSEGGKFTVAGAISWRDMPKTATMAMYLWPLMIVFAAAWGTFSLRHLWQMVIHPIQKLEEEVSNLRWGYEKLSEAPINAIPDIRNMQSALIEVSKNTMKTMTVNRICMNDLVSVQEDERTTISRDIHDGPIQDVTALIQRIYLARRPDNTEEDSRRELDLAEKIALATVKEMRALCDFLNPPWLELGLSQALTELTERQSLQYGVRIFLGVDDTLNLSDAVTLAFFRVVQEAVTNSVRHGEAKNIWVDVKRNDDGEIELTVQDDGHGFDMPEGEIAELRFEGHRGLSNMEERMTLAGGRLKIISYPGEGTCIRGLIP